MLEQEELLVQGDNQELEPVPTKKEQEELRKQNKDRHKKLKSCQKALKSIHRGVFFWMFMLLAIPGGIAGGIAGGFASGTLGTQQWLSPSFNFQFIFSCFGGFVLLCLLFSRVKSSITLKKRLPKDYRKCMYKMPDFPTDTVQEIYCSLHCKRCFYFWTSFCVFALALITFVYTGIYVLVIWCSDGKQFSENLKNGFVTGGSNFTSSTTRPLACGSLGMMLLVLLNYWFWNSKIRKNIKYMECIYGKELLINDCLLAYRVNEVNKKCKTVCFSITCILGCVIYLFFKKLILTIFEKSFSI